MTSHTPTVKSIDELDVDDSWKVRFRLIEEYYTDGIIWKGSDKIKAMPSKEFNKIFQNIVFNKKATGTFVSVFLLGFFYYLFKGMWLKAIIYSFVSILGFVLLGAIGSYAIWGGFAMLAPFDYYRFKVLGKQW